jgi:hypothetical protein
VTGGTRNFPGDKLGQEIRKLGGPPVEVAAADTDGNSVRTAAERQLGSSTERHEDSEKR